MAAGARAGPRREAAAALPDLAGAGGRRRGSGCHVHRGAGCIQREREARAQLDAALSELAPGIPRHLLGGQPGRPTEAAPRHTENPLARLAGAGLPCIHSSTPRSSAWTPAPALVNSRPQHNRRAMSDLRPIADRVEIEALRGEYTALGAVVTHCRVLSGRKCPSRREGCSET